MQIMNHYYLANINMSLITNYETFLAGNHTKCYTAEENNLMQKCFTPFYFWSNSNEQKYDQVLCIARTRFMSQPTHKP